MKRLLALFALICLLLCGCDLVEFLPEGFPTIPFFTKAPEPTEMLQPATNPSATTAPATQTPITEPAVPTEPAETEPPETEPPETEPELVTVYLLVKAVYCDNGYEDFYYDEDYNVIVTTSYTIENDLRCKQHFEMFDANGMPQKTWTQWLGGYEGDAWILSYFADGKLKEEQIEDGSYIGYQYAYDSAGNRTEKREYYEGILQSVVYYEYAGEQLSAVYCEGSEGNKIYECRIENGLIVEKIFLDTDDAYSYRYQYDANNNLVEMTVCYEGEDMPGDQYFYEAVEVDAERAQYLKEQQKYLIAIT